jgi:diguanylate cyclase (GGDEF)-like protein
MREREPDPFFDTSATARPSVGQAGARRRFVGRVAALLFSLGALSALATMPLLSDPRLPSSFELVIALALASGIACAFTPWNLLSPRWLHAVPIVGTIEVALAVWTAGSHGSIYGIYYAFVALFAAYAFQSRRAIAAHVALAAAARTLPLLSLRSVGGDVAAKTLLAIVLMAVIAAVVMLLRERLEQREHELEKLVLSDPLTGVGNYRLLSERLNYEIARHVRSGESLTVLLLDLDGFKQVNDTWGHLAGDRVLCKVAQALASSIRAHDTLARQGGDEFSIIAPQTSELEARRLAARMSETVASATDGLVTTCVGWATYPGEAENPAVLLELADAELRGNKAQRAGDQDRRSVGSQAEVAQVAGAWPRPLAHHIRG